MLRRDFLKSTGAALAFSAMPAYAAQYENTKKRVALIGTGWYGKSDLFRLLQVAPLTEVVSLCDADSNLLNECADMSRLPQAAGPSRASAPNAMGRAGGRRGRQRVPGRGDGG